MNTPSVITELQKIQAQIQSVPTGNEKLTTLIAFRLSKLIKANPALQDQWNERIHHYGDLAENKEYQALISQIHVAMHELHRKIEISKTPRVLRDPEASEFDREKGRVFKLSIDKLLMDDAWLILDENNWQSVLVQYTDELDTLLMSLHIRRAISDDVYGKYSHHFRELGKKLRLLLETPWHDKNLKAFKDLQQFIDNVERDRDLQFDPFFSKIKEAADVVCVELLQSFDILTSSSEDLFSYAGTLTDFRTNLIHSEADKSRKQLLKYAKKRYVWKFYRSTYDQKEATSAELNEFVNRNLKKFDHNNKLVVQTVTRKDIESIVTTISKLGNCPVEKLTPHFVFGETIFLKKIGS